MPAKLPWTGASVVMTRVPLESGRPEKLGALSFYVSSDRGPLETTKPLELKRNAEYHRR